MCEDIFLEVEYCRERFTGCNCVIAGDFNCNIDSSDPVAKLVILPLLWMNGHLKVVTNNFFVMYLLHNVNQALNQQSYIDYVLVSSIEDISGFLFWIRRSIFLTTCHCLFLLCVWLAGINRLILRGMYVRQGSIFHVGIRQMLMPIIIIVAPVLFH